MSMQRQAHLAASARCREKWLTISVAAFRPTNGDRSSAAACAIRSIDPNSRSSFIFRLSPMPGNFGQLGREIAFLATFAMKFDRGLMRFLADLQDEPKRERIPVEWYGLVLAAIYQQMRDLACAVLAA